jgi:hypothetical protein
MKITIDVVEKQPILQLFVYIPDYKLIYNKEIFSTTAILSQHYDPYKIIFNVQY